MTKRSDSQNLAEFQVAVARLAGLDPASVAAGSLVVDIERGPDGETAAYVQARVHVAVDATEVTRLAMEFDRIRPASA